MVTSSIDVIRWMVELFLKGRRLYRSLLSSTRIVWVGVLGQNTSRVLLVLAFVWSFNTYSTFNPHFKLCDRSCPTWWGAMAVAMGYMQRDGH